MLKVLISASPEDFSEAFTKLIKERGLQIKLKVWSRDDHAKQGHDLYLLTQRDFAYLDKIRQLPPPGKLIAIFSPSYKESFLLEKMDVRFTGFIMGEVEERARRSVDLIDLYFNHHHLGQSSNSLSDIQAPAWLLKRAESVASDLREVSPQSQVHFFQDQDNLTLKVDNCSFKFSPEDFQLGLNPHSTSKDPKISGVVLHRIFDSATTFLQISNASGGQQIIIQFRLLKSQKKYENFPKLFAVLPSFEGQGVP